MTRVFPVGRYLGMLPVGTELKHVVRVGGHRVDLPDDDYLVWALAHGVPGSPDLKTWDRAAITRHEPEISGDVFDRLLKIGLLIEEGDEFARAVRLLPQAVGLGNGVAHSRTFRIGFPQAPLASVPAEVFYLWAWAGLDADLWAACQRGAVAAGGPSAGPGALVAEMLGHLHALLSVNAACLDKAGVTA